MKDKEIIATVNLTIPEGKTIALVDERAKSKIPNYYMIGNGTMNKHQIQSINLVKASNNCSAPARQVIDWIMDGMVYVHTDNAVRFVVELNDTLHDMRTVKRGFKELSEKDLVRRVKRGHYMLNPNAIITNYDRQIAVWNECARKNKDTNDLA